MIRYKIIFGERKNTLRTVYLRKKEKKNIYQEAVLIPELILSNYYILDFQPNKDTHAYLLLF